MPGTLRADLVAATARFCRLLRARGIPVTSAGARDALRVLEQVDLADRDEMRLALRAVLASSPREVAAFDALFDAFWGGPAAGLGGADGETEGTLVAARFPKLSQETPEFAGWTELGEGSGEPLGLPGLSDLESLGTKDFSAFTPSELDEVERLAARLARRLATRRSRRAGAPGPRGRVDLRRTLRRSLTRGEPVELVRRERKLQKTKLVVLCDVSGSMDLYSRLLLQFLHALQNHLGRVETFVFSTGLERVTERLQGRSYRQALDELGRLKGWSGGTKIGESLTAFLAGWRRLLDRDTVVLILSDGWDTGDPALLVEALIEMKRRAPKIVWLNPLLGNPDYEPLTQGMAAALPHVDAFLPAHNLESLRDLARYLRT
jgi:uncharacterized protein with von Willebrand factor type A (vWA) domain